MRTIKARNGFVFTFPFEPPWEDLRAEGSTPNGGKFYIFDSCVIRDPEERAAIDRGSLMCSFRQSAGSPWRLWRRRSRKPKPPEKGSKKAGPPCGRPARERWTSMRTLKTSRRELEHVAVCVTGEVSAEFIRDIQETMRRENQRRRDAGRPGMSYTVSGGEGSPEEWLRKALNRDLGNGATRDRPLRPGAGRPSRSHRLPIES